MVKSIYDPARGKMKVVGLTSGSGNTLWSAYKLQQEMEKTFEGCPFEVVGVFSDTPGSKSMRTAQELGIPAQTLDIREFYAQRNKPLKDMDVRAEYDREVVKLLQKWSPDFVVLAGYVWAVTNVITDHFAVFGVHPGDLTVQENGVRLLAGANGVKSAFRHHRDELRASSYIASSELDGGPILVTSPPVPVDYHQHQDEEERFRYYLKLVNAQSREVGARTVLELALGNFQTDGNGGYYYKGEPIPMGIQFEDWEENPPRYLSAREKMLSPKSIAVIGASQKPGIGQSIIRNIQQFSFQGKVYAINLRGESVLGVKGYASVLDIPEALDMAVIALPSRFVLDVAEQCGKKGVKAIICISAGFKEVGGDGIAQEKKLLDMVNRYGMCMIGPNCMGAINTDPAVSMNATILSDVPRRGNVAMLTQSGALGAAMEDFCSSFQIGFSSVVSVGNQTDMNICDFLPLLEQDPNTKVILLYMEGIPEPQRFRNIVSKMKKPVVVYKAGKTKAGAAAAGSHTGSLAGNAQVASALLRQSGAIECASLEDAFRLTATLSKTDLLRGNRIGIASNTGGLGIITSDALTKLGFALPPLPQACADDLRPKLLPEASVRNPIDIVAPATPEQYREVISQMTTCGAYDAILITVVPAATVKSEDIAAAMIDPIQASPIPVLACFFGPEIAGKGAAVLRKNGVPTFEYPEKMVDILRYMYASEKARATCQIPGGYDPKAVADIRQKVCAEPSGAFLPVELCQEVLAVYGIATARSAYLKTPSDVYQIGLDYPVVIKVDHPDIIHKSDVGGVRLNVGSAEELSSIMEEWIPKFPGLLGAFVQEQISGKLELIVGCTFDTTLGHAVLAGMGGTQVELINDVSFGHVPISPDDAADMLRRLKYYPLLKGYRGESGVNIAKLEELILRVNQLLLDIPEIAELDLNPLIFSEKADNFISVDCRIKLR